MVFQADYAITLEAQLVTTIMCGTTAGVSLDLCHFQSTQLVSGPAAQLVFGPAVVNPDLCQTQLVSGSICVILDWCQIHLVPTPALVSGQVGVGLDLCHILLVSSDPPEVRPSCCRIQLVADRGGVKHSWWQT